MLSLIAVAVLLVFFAVTVSSKVIVGPLIFLWGIASFALVPPLQSLVVQEAKEAPSLSSAMNIGAFNLGNALGAMLGAALISSEFSLRVVPLAGAGTAILAIIMALLFGHSRNRREKPLPDAT
jgi:DHA1 family inner membrane transport protein